MYAYPEDESNSIDLYDEPRLHMERLLKARLIEFDLSMRILIPLEDAGIRTLGDLTSRTEAELMAVSQLGVTRVERIKAVLDRYGLSLAKKAVSRQP